MYPSDAVFTVRACEMWSVARFLIFGCIGERA